MASGDGKFLKIQQTAENYEQRAHNKAARAMLFQKMLSAWRNLLKFWSPQL